ncbi:hypothetical protein SSX86_020137 [Deinandra increscens subsp. villosa]|uniref:RING-type E3 ubiquitin transferase n=1 Tax=Deinandra increscens subsp. villosa TaxID=3103831 RepID=A0AAP0CS87_9ASTR
MIISLRFCYKIMTSFIPLLIQFHTLIFTDSTAASNRHRKLIAYPTPRPSPPSDHHHQQPSTPLQTLFVVLIATVIFSIRKCCTMWCRSRRRRRTPPPENQETRGNNGVVAHPHPIWHIRTTGLQPSVINALTVVKFSGGVVEGTDCSVCLTEFEGDDTLRILPNCKHAFHMPCIDTWLRSHTNCPLCRALVVVDSEEPKSNLGFTDGINLGILTITEYGG